MRISIGGAHVLGSVQGIYLDGQLLMPNAGLSADGGDFFSTSCLWYGGWNGPSPGIYTAPLTSPSSSFLGTFNAGNVTAFWTDGISRWLANYIDGARDSQGHYWPDRVAMGASRQGDWLFISNTFNTLIVRSAAGVETSYPANFTYVAMDQGVILYALAGQAPTAINAPTPQLTNWMTFTTRADGTRVLGGQALGGQLCVCEWAAAPMGYVLSSDGQDFNPAIAVRASDGLIVIATGQNAGETIQRLYAIDLPNQRFNVNNGPWQAMTLVNLVSGGDVPEPPTPDPPTPEPPTPIPVPPDPIPVPPLPPDPIPEPPNPGGHVKYLSYQLVNGAVVATRSETLDLHSLFYPDGNLYTLNGPPLGFNVQVVGSKAPGGQINFQRIPMGYPGWDATPAGDFGVLHPQADGTVAIEWPE